MRNFDLILSDELTALNRAGASKNFLKKNLSDLRVNVASIPANQPPKHRIYYKKKVKERKQLSNENTHTLRQVVGSKPGGRFPLGRGSICTHTKQTYAKAQKSQLFYS